MKLARLFLWGVAAWLGGAALCRAESIPWSYEITRIDVDGGGSDNISGFPTNVVRAFTPDGRGVGGGVSVSAALGASPSGGRLPAPGTSTSSR